MQNINDFHLSFPMKKIRCSEYLENIFWYFIGKIDYIKNNMAIFNFVENSSIYNVFYTFIWKNIKLNFVSSKNSRHK